MCVIMSTSSIPNTNLCSQSTAELSQLLGRWDEWQRCGLLTLICPLIFQLDLLVVLSATTSQLKSRKIDLSRKVVVKIKGKEKDLTDELVQERSPHKTTPQIWALWEKQGWQQRRRGQRLHDRALKEGKVPALATFCCCDNTPWPRQLIEEKIHLGL